MNIEGQIIGLTFLYECANTPKNVQILCAQECADVHEKFANGAQMCKALQNYCAQNSGVLG